MFHLYFGTTHNFDSPVMCHDLKQTIQTEISFIFKGFGLIQTRFDH